MLRDVEERVGPARAQRRAKSHEGLRRRKEVDAVGKLSVLNSGEKGSGEHVTAR
jgi:hypothetical protein